MADSRDILGKNRKFTGTSGIKLPEGNTAQRDTGQGAGAIRFNTETATAEYYDGTNWQAISAPPQVSTVSPTNVISGDGSTQTFTITGSNFTVAGATASFVGDDGSIVSALSTVVNSSTSITATATQSAFANAKEPYDVQITNNTGLSNSLADAITVDNRPAWDTTAGSLGSIGDENTGTHFTISATDPEGDTVSYAVVAGALPGGTSLNSATGAISGNPTNVGSSTTSTFTVRASATGDGGALTADRQFSITVTPAPTGGTITSYSTYTVHTFTSPGTFNTVVPIPGADILLVGGGGGGGGHHEGGGGAGGMIELPNNTIPANPYSISIGSGGGSDTNGQNTTGFGQTANGGGASVGYSGGTANAGGSGGGGPAPGSGGSSNQGGVSSPWTGNAYGNSGGNGTGGPPHAGGGGGGAGGAGASGSPGNGGQGGSGRQNVYYDGTNDYYAAGGGGGGWDAAAGVGGTGGGGNGSQRNNQSTAPNATGIGCGGGGNGGQGLTGGSGSAGIVVIRFQ
jgi:hypothetical protein